MNSYHTPQSHKLNRESVSRESSVQKIKNPKHESVKERDVEVSKKDLMDPQLLDRKKNLNNEIEKEEDNLAQ